MNIKACMVFIFYVCMFQGCMGAESALVSIDFMAIADSDCLETFDVSSKGLFDLDRFIGQSSHHIGKLKNLEKRGLIIGSYLISVNRFTFSNGKKGYVGLLPANSTIYKLPCSEHDTFGYKCKSGVVVYMKLSQDPISLVHQNF